VSGIVAGTEDDGRIQVITDGRDCVKPGDVRGAHEGDGVNLSRSQRVDGLPQAPPAFYNATAPAARPEVLAADPELWAGGDVLLAGRNLDGVQSVGLSLPSPLAAEEYPGVTVNSITPGTDTQLTINVSVDLGEVPSPETIRGGVAVDNEETDAPRYLTEDLFEPGEPVITSVEPEALWSDDLIPPGEGYVINVTCHGQGLGAIDTIDFGLPPSGPGASERWQSQVVTNATGDTLTVELTVGDSFEPYLTPYPIEFGTGGLQYTSAPLWKAHAPIVDIEGWRLFVGAWDYTPDVGPVESIAAGLYAWPQPFDPSQAGAVPLAGRTHPLPVALPTTYSPSGPASTAGYQGRISADWYGGTEGRLVIAERGDALPDGGTGTPQSYGAGTGPWWVVWDIVSGVLHAPVTWPAENRLVGPVVTGSNVYALSYQQGVGAQVVTADVPGTTPAVVGTRKFGNPPHEALAFDGSTLTASTWAPTPGQFPPSAQKWTVGNGVRTVVTYTTDDRLTSEWSRENRTASERPGTNGLRWGTRFERARPWLISVGATVTETDGYPNLSTVDTTLRLVTAGTGPSEADAFRGAVTGDLPLNGRVMISQVDGGLARYVEDTTPAASLTVDVQVPMGDWFPANEVAQAVFPAHILPDGVP
jgi:hypothetical protein